LGFFYKNGYSIVQLNKKWGAIDSTGKIIIPIEYERLSNLFDGFFCAKKQNKFGYINVNNETMIPFMYDYAYDFKDGLAKVGINNIGLSKGRRYGFINTTGKEVISLIYDDIHYFQDGLSCVKKNRKSGFIDFKGKTVIPLVYQNATETFTNGYAIVQNEMGKWGLIDKSNKLIIPFKYDMISSEQELKGIFRVTNFQNYLPVPDYIDAKGQNYFEN